MRNNFNIFHKHHPHGKLVTVLLIVGILSVIADMGWIIHSQQIEVRNIASRAYTAENDRDYWKQRYMDTTEVGKIMKSR